MAVPLPMAAANHVATVLRRHAAISRRTAGDGAQLLDAMMMASWARSMSGRAKAPAAPPQGSGAVVEALLPKVAVVGRPNVGKSALFNRLVRRRQALVYDTPTSHVTRDYQQGLAQLADLRFRVSDTSGLEPRSSEKHTLQGRATAITAKVLQQSHLALMVVDAREGVVPADEELAAWLCRHVPRDKVLLVANKAEGAKARDAMPQTVYDCYRLGFGEPVAVSATTGEGMSDLFVALQPYIDEVSQQLRQSYGMEPGAGGSASNDVLPPTRPWPVDGTTAHELRGSSAAAAGPLARSTAEAEPQRSVQRARLFDNCKGHSAQEAQGSAGGATQPDVSTASAAAVADQQAGATTAGDDDDGDDGCSGESAGHPGIMKFAIMGLPNAGKSTLLNALLGEQRSLTGPEAGLTRDAVRAAWTYRGMAVELVDTAGWVGIQRVASYDDVGGELATLARRATAKALAQVHVVLLVLDAERALRTQRVIAQRELALAGLALREGKALVVVANKVDALTKEERANYVKVLRDRLQERFTEAGQVQVVEVSALQGSGMDDIMPVATAAYQAWNKRVSTGRLNRFVRKLELRMLGSGMESTLARVKYLTQVKARPPTFSAFLSGSSPVSASFSAFLAQQIRQVLGFQGVPIRLWCRCKDSYATHAQRLKSGASEHAKRMVALPSYRPPAFGVEAADAEADGQVDEPDMEEEEEEEEETPGRARGPRHSERSSSSGSGGEARVGNAVVLERRVRDGAGDTEAAGALGWVTRIEPTGYQLAPGAHAGAAADGGAAAAAVSGASSQRHGAGASASGRAQGGGTSQGAPGRAGRADSSKALYRSMLYSRKPSAGPVPVTGKPGGGVHSAKRPAKQQRSTAG